MAGAAPGRTDYYDRVLEAAAFLRAHAPGPFTVAVVLGSGLGAFADRLADAVVVPYARVPHWPACAVVGHEGRLVMGRVGARVVAALAGRVHYYEGHALGTVTFPIRVLGVLGVRTLVLTNAAGGIRPDLAPGTLMVIDDHLNLMGANPLVGPNDERFGPRFPDLTDAYAPRLRAIADEAARSLGVPLAHGVYAALAGPSYETPAEIRFLRTIGADAVGMSTVPETIVARHMGIEVLGLSCITNLAAGVAPRPLRHDEVMATADRVRDTFASLLEAILVRL
jgi:purine-nucleoside phosphorylase